VERIPTGQQDGDDAAHGHCFRDLPIAPNAVEEVVEAVHLACARGGFEEDARLLTISHVCEHALDEAALLLVHGRDALPLRVPGLRGIKRNLFAQCLAIATAASAALNSSRANEDSLGGVTNLRRCTFSVFFREPVASSSQVQTPYRTINLKGNK